MKLTHSESLSSGNPSVLSRLALFVLALTLMLGGALAAAGGKGALRAGEPEENGLSPARFCQLILNGGELDGVRLVSRKTIELMSADHLSKKVAPGDLYLSGPGQGFGLGFAVRRSVGVSGYLCSRGAIRWSGMAGTAFWIDPEERLICIWMIQDIPQNNHYRQRFKNLVYQAITD